MKKIMFTICHFLFAALLSLSCTPESNDFQDREEILEQNDSQEKETSESEKEPDGETNGETNGEPDDKSDGDTGGKTDEDTSHKTDENTGGKTEVTDVEIAKIPDLGGKCIALVDECIVALAEGNLYVSMDLGETWSQGPDVTSKGYIRNAYVFADSTLFFCTDQACYYSDDWKNVHESTVLDVDGTRFSPGDAIHHFSAYEHDGFRQTVAGKEVLCWGNYNNEEVTNPRYIPRIWLTTDSGKTVRCCFKFGESRIGDRLISARHVHAVNFNPGDQTFWAQTGDTASQSHWLKGVYNPDRDSIDWTIIGTGMNFKTGNMQFYQDWIIFSHDASPKGVFRIPYAWARDMSCREQILETPNECIAVYVGKKGDLVAIMTSYGGKADPRTIYYSPNQKDVFEIEGPIPEDLLKYGYSVYYNTWGIAPGGRLLSGIRTKGKGGPSKWDLTPSVWLNEVLAKAGFPDALK